MTDEPTADLTSPEPAVRAKALIVRGISRVNSGEHEAAMSDLLDAQALATEANLDGLVRAALINQGYAFTVQGDSEGAVRRYQVAATLARDASDTDRLVVALANLSVELKALGRHEDAVSALDEYLDLLGDDALARARALTSRATSLIEIGDKERASRDLDAADEAVGESSDEAIRHSVKIAKASLYLRQDDMAAARVVLQQALDAARSMGDQRRIQEATTSLAQVCRSMELFSEADSLFADAEAGYRESGDVSSLGDALYWHGVVLESMGRRDLALTKWREEEEMRRTHGQDGHLAECLHVQADAMRSAGDHQAADLLYAEAGDVFERLDLTIDLASLRYWHAVSLRALGRSSDALTRAEQAIEASSANNDPGIERRAQALRAMALADLGDLDAANSALDAAEALCQLAEARTAMVWTLARRAYVVACGSGAAEDVVEQLRKAHNYAMVHGEPTVSSSAVRKMMAEISNRCSDRYDEALSAFRNEQLADIAPAIEGAAPRGSTRSAAESEATGDEPTAQDAADTEADEE